MEALRNIFAITAILCGFSLVFYFLIVPADTHRKPFWLLAVYIVAVILGCIYFF